MHTVSVIDTVWPLRLVWVNTLAYIQPFNMSPQQTITNTRTPVVTVCVLLMAHYTPTQLFLREIKAQSNNGSV